jgi:pentapeptide MXKDX repeat protein
MNRIALYVFVTCFAAASSIGTPAWADDANSARPVVSPKQMMKDCMAKERQANPTASNEDMKKVCLAKIDSYNKHPSETTLPPNNP